MQISTDRRALVSAGLAAGSLFLVGGVPTVLADESVDPAWMPSWNYEADVIVVGVGGAGVAALNEARECGLSVIGLEQMGAVGGNAAICGGEITAVGTPLQEAQGIEDSPEQLYDDMMALGADVNSDMMKLYAELQTTIYDWVCGFGIEFESEVKGTNGHSVPRGHFIDAHSAVNTMADAALAAGAEIHFETALTDLVQDPVTRRVVGVKATGPDGEPLYYKARRGVVMCSGGYAQNNDMINEYVTGVGAETFRRQGRETDNGTGMIACMNIGVATRHISYCSFSCILNADPGCAQGSAMYHEGGILVNQEGERFVDESNGYTNVWTDVVKQTDSICYCIWDQAIADANTGQGGAYYDHQKALDSGYLLHGETVEELAGAIGCPVETLQATLDRYNADVEATGVDGVFGRDHFVTGTGELVTIDHAPYYAWKTCVAIGSSRGGLKKDLSCQALDMKGNVVPGLFLAGVISGTSEMGIVPGTRQSKTPSGAGFGGALSFGRYAVRQISELMQPWDEI